MSSPTARTLQTLRSEGWTAGITEKWNQHARKRFDLYGFIDVLAMHPEKGLLAVQATSGSNAAARVQKICGECRRDAVTFLKAGRGMTRIEVWSWSKTGKVGKRKLWTCRRQQVTAEMLGMTGEAQ